MPSWFNLPNLICVARLALTPFIVRSILDQRYDRALAFFLIAGVSDGLDGFLARRFGWITRLGAYLDPIADKTLLVSVYLALGAAGGLPVWLVGLVVLRDIVILLMSSAGFLLFRCREFPPAIWGKLSTFLQIATALAAILRFALPDWSLGTALTVFIGLTAAGTTWSGLYYIWRALRIFRTVRCVAAK